MGRSIAQCRCSPSRNRGKSRTVRLCARRSCSGPKRWSMPEGLMRRPDQLLCASELGAWSLREHLGMFWQLCSQIQRSSRESTRAVSAKSTANLAGTGQRLRRKGTRDHRPADSVAFETRDNASHDGSQFGSRLASSLASVFDLSHDAGLLGNELMDAIRLTNCSPDVRIARARAHPPSAGTSCSIALGHQKGERSLLSCDVPR